MFADNRQASGGPVNVSPANITHLLGVPRPMRRNGALHLGGLGGVSWRLGDPQFSRANCVFVLYTYIPLLSRSPFSVSSRRREPLYEKRPSNIGEMKISSELSRIVRYSRFQIYTRHDCVSFFLVFIYTYLLKKEKNRAYAIEQRLALYILFLRAYIKKQYKID